MAITAEQIKDAMALVSTGLSEIKQYQTNVATQEKVADKQTKMQDIAAIINLVGTAAPGAISIVRECYELIKILTNKDADIISIEDKAALDALLEQMPHPSTLPVPADVQAAIDAREK
jgi:hypothetical protein